MRAWKVLGLAGVAGLVATGAVVARSERRRRAYTAADVRARLHERHEHGPGTLHSTPAASAASDEVVAPGSTLDLDTAVELTRTGDLWLFRGKSAADHAIRAFTNAPVNHVGMAFAVDDLPPLMWHAELGQSLPDLWSGTNHRGVQLHDLRDAVVTWTNRYGQQAWLRQLSGDVSPAMEAAVLEEVARKDGLAFPATFGLVRRWLRGRVNRPAKLEMSYCAEVVAGAYQAMGILGPERATNWYDPGRFWSGDRLDLEPGFALGDEIAITVDPTEVARKA
jgi:hypothetical protein